VLDEVVSKRVSGDIDTCIEFKVAAEWYVGVRNVMTVGVKTAKLQVDLG
jgi:hypothetical protein